MINISWGRLHDASSVGNRKWVGSVMCSPGSMCWMASSISLWSRVFEVVDSLNCSNIFSHLTVSGVTFWPLYLTYGSVHESVSFRTRVEIESDVRLRSDVLFPRLQLLRRVFIQSAHPRTTVLYHEPAAAVCQRHGARSLFPVSLKNISSQY